MDLSQLPAYRPMTDLEAQKYSPDATSVATGTVASVADEAKDEVENPRSASPVAWGIELRRQSEMDLLQKHLENMGFSGEDARVALVYAKGSVEGAVEYLCCSEADRDRLVFREEGESGELVTGFVGSSASPGGVVVADGKLPELFFGVPGGSVPQAGAGVAESSADVSNVVVRIDSGRDEKDDEMRSAKCMVCLEDHKEDEMRVLGCDHAFCQSCMKEYYRLKITEGQVRDHQMICPYPDCKQSIKTDVIRLDVEDELWKKYQKFCENAKLAMDPNVRWCTTPGCETPLVGKWYSRRLKCTKCGSNLCFKCGGQYHGYSSCVEDERHYNEWAKDKNIKKCPKCKIRISKIDGCNAMHCSCGFKFCWLCERELTRYHYKEWNVFYGCPGMQNEGFEWDIVRRFLWKLLFILIIPIAAIFAWPIGVFMLCCCYPCFIVCGSELNRDIVYTYTWYFLSCYYTFWDPFAQFQH